MKGENDIHKKRHSTDNNLQKIQILQTPSIQLQFNDDTHINLSTQKSANSKNKFRTEQSQIQNCPKKKHLYTVCNWKDPNILEHYQKQKRDVLKNQLNMIMIKRQKQASKKNQILPINLKGTQNEKQTSVKQNNKIHTKKQLKPEDMDQKFNYQRKSERRRSKTEVYVYQNQTSQKNLDHKTQKLDTESSLKLLDNKYSFSERRKNKKESKFKKIPMQFKKNQNQVQSYSHQIRQICNRNHISEVNNDDEDNSSSENAKRKQSIQSQKPYRRVRSRNEDTNMKNFRLTKNSHLRMSKSIMVQKIINLRKTFNDKFKKSPNKSYINCSNNPKLTNHDVKLSQLDFTSNAINSLQYFPLSMAASDYDKKMTFHELFLHQKKKMEILKKILEKNNSLVESEGKIHRILEQVNNQNRQVCGELSHFLNSKSFHQNELLHQNKMVSLQKNQKNLCQQTQQQQIEQCPNANPDKVAPQKKSHSQDKSKNGKKGYHSHLTTYNFDYFGKRRSQRPEVKQLRHKYLYSNHNHHYAGHLRRFSSQPFEQETSIVSVHQSGEGTLKKWRKKYMNDTFSGQCIQIEKIPIRFNKYEQMIGNRSHQANCTKIKIRRNQNIQTVDQIIRKQREMGQGEFQPWEDLHSKHQNHEYDIQEISL